MVRKLCIASILSWTATVLADDGAAAHSPVDFVRDVAPILEKNCLRCHHPGNEKGQLSLTTAEHLLHNEYVVPGRPDDSPLIGLVVGRLDEIRPAMPKDGTPLTQIQVDVLKQWIAQGAFWDKDVVLHVPTAADRSWWALRPLVQVRPPEIRPLEKDWRNHPIDRFIGAKLAEVGAQPSPPADRRTLIRRLTFDLTGLPPTPDEIRAFESDAAPDAYERLVDRLLASPRYGERWGRHWLDVIRFGESNGFERNVLIPSLWPFRDYVIRSLNEDKPFDRLVEEHLAGDLIASDDPAVAIGTAFLVCGPYDNVGNEDAVQAANIRANTIDEIVRTCGEAFLGMTVGCARCHDHKFDPITQRDYYGWYATFAGVFHGERIVADEQARRERHSRLMALEDTIKQLRRQRQEICDRALARARLQVATIEPSWTRDAANRFGTEEVFPACQALFVRLRVVNRDDDPHANSGFRIDEFEIWTEPDPAAGGPASRNVALSREGAVAQGGSRVAEDFSGAYGAELTIDGQFGARWLAAEHQLTIRLARPERIGRVVFSSDRTRSLPPDSSLTPFVGDYLIETSLDEKNWIRVADSSTRKPNSAGHRDRRLIEREITDLERDQVARLDAQIAQLQNEISRLPALPSLWVGRFESNTGPYHVFLGGDPQRQGDEVAPTSLSMLDESATPYRLDAASPEGQRRQTLATWLVSADNPLTPRVLANRLWQWHFGTGIVDTPSDFGFMGGKPTHPDLLDWLAGQVRESGWRWKPLHRLIVTSQTYRQSSAWREDLARIDADSRWLWRFPARRLSAEEVRDSMLMAARVLNDTMGGPGFRLYRYLEDNVATYVPLDRHEPATWRRGVYHQNARAQQIDIMSDFDCPDSAFSVARRGATTSPLQALTMMNHSFTIDMAGHLARRVTAESAAIPDQIDRAFEFTLGRLPDSLEMENATRLVHHHGLDALCRALFNTSEFIHVN
jgi:hypothetical protein